MPGKHGWRTRPGRRFVLKGRPVSRFTGWRDCTAFWKRAALAAPAAWHDTSLDTVSKPLYSQGRGGRSRAQPFHLGQDGPRSYRRPHGTRSEGSPVICRRLRRVGMDGCLSSPAWDLSEATQRRELR